MEAELENLWSQIDGWPIAEELRGMPLFNPGPAPGELVDFSQLYGGLLPADLRCQLRGIGNALGSACRLQP